jgi:hypothetical protein
MRRFINLINNPAKIIYLIRKLNLSFFLNDKQFLKMQYKAVFNRKLNLTNPRTYNEKLQYLKLYDRNPIYPKIVDKLAVRNYVNTKIGNQYLTKIYGVYNSVYDIEFTKLPDKFVIKANHDSGSVFICRNKDTFVTDQNLKKINNSLKINYYKVGREWPYKNIVPKIFVEEYLETENTMTLPDYKIFCFDGQPKALFVASDRGHNTKFDFYDIEFKKLNIKQYYPNSNYIIQKPKNYDEMIDISKKLSENIKHVRVDLYNINGKIYFGELTLTHFSGLKKFTPNKWDLIFGSWLELDKDAKLK